MVTMDNDGYVFLKDPISENRNRGYHWKVVNGLDGDPNSISLSYLRTSGRTCYLRARNDMEIDCSVTTDQEHDPRQYSWYVHEMLEKEFYNKHYNDPRG